MATDAGRESPLQRRRFASLVAAAWVLLTLPRLLAHELWRDEAWQWLVARESHSLAELFEAQSRGGGSGYLFPLLCFLARQASASPLAMQLVNLAVGGAAAFVFARWAPLGRFERALFVFGYFPFYEYAVISRSYGLGALLVWIACAATASRRPALALGASLALLCQTTIYGFLLALALGGGWFVARWRERRRTPLPAWPELAGGLALAATGAIAGLVQLAQAPETRTFPFRFAWNPVAALKVAMTPWRALVPVPQPDLHFWNTNWLDPWPAAQAAAGLAALALAIALLRRSSTALATLLLGAAGLLAFGYLFLPGSARHHGHLWLLVMAALWLGGGAAGLARWRRGALRAILVLHCAVAAFASWIDLRHPFSNGAATAALIRERGLDRHPLLGHREPPAATVALYLGQPLYSPSRKAWVTHPDWGPRQRELRDPELRCAARELAAAQGRDIVLVINRELPSWPELEPIAATRGAIVTTENYVLYWLRHGRVAASVATAACPGEVR